MKDGKRKNKKNESKGLRTAIANIEKAFSRKKYKHKMDKFQRAIMPLRDAAWIKPYKN